MNVLADLAALQHEDGSFPSVIETAAGRRPDRNGFVTALVIRGLRYRDRTSWHDMRTCGLQFLLHCRSRNIAGAFTFWPDAARPAWAPAVPADADDTAIITMELLRYGWLDRRAARRSICTALLPFRIRVEDIALAPPWIVAGSFPTWLARPAGNTTNMVDCCVNANVAALMAGADARHLPGYDEAVRTVVAGLDWANGNALRLASLTPFYPSTWSLVESLEHAVECGAREFGTVLAALSAWSRENAGPRGSEGVCRGAYGTTVWHSAAVDCLHGRGDAHAAVSC